jgi:uncharacterized OsmC-like protein
MAQGQGPDTLVRAATSGTFGRVLLSAGTNHLVVDGPVRNGCPGEAITPAELFLGGVASCAVELVEVIARADGVPLTGVEAEISGTIDREHAIRSDVTVFSSVDLRFTLRGVDDEQAARLVRTFQDR